ncbi:nucleoside triphosphate pyrophosphohydrolase [Pseudohoeflea coraliihabitans]|uniref:Nucleoside triphosphate pyrophosphohydrolase n=1 Tax=Pseudohoeflea coraliihabitans TaxID=2860393 RepID=A0ABS6WRN5_9HYPH|nr:nucleoside triphosphate pyrophosphohydrolase [Pseudohoeflea sp. DP4N28-3]MBW3098450.1 nucleoside triphosphate pyrophosphohydrolase [Pseudohoeflea sp. DP4N28-3]
MTPSRDISRLVEIMQLLRDPEDGCPWDVKQDFESIKPYTIEEAYEVADAIERADYDDLCDELGDLLLQVVFHARMAEEAGHFAFGDVVSAITAKMIRRHPHVFAVSDADSPELVKTQWADIKAAEKAERARRRAERDLPSEDPAEHLDSVPRSLPALMEAVKLQDSASRVGFDWGAAGPVLDKIEEEIAELRSAIAEGAHDAAAEELGDVMFALANLGRHLKTDAEMALRGTNSKFRRRFAHIEAQLGREGRTLEAATLAEMEAYWQDAKRVERQARAAKAE